MTKVEERFVGAVTRRIGRRKPFSRRSFLVRSAVVGSALAVNPFRFVFKPGTAYAAACGTDPECGDGWTAMCCSINQGSNTCPPGSIAAGWWKVDNSGFCGGGPRYYIDCNAGCGSCGCGSGGVCSSACNNCSCRCNSGSCDQRAVCCNQFRYGQCHMDVCVGAVVCRVISCSPPWEFDPTCSTVSATSFATALHDAPCLHGSKGIVRAFGAAPFRGEPQGTLRAPIVGMESTETGNGYWLVASDGGVFSFGDATFRGSTGAMRLNKPIVDLASTKGGGGYWLVASDGGIFTFGNARFFGSTGAIRRTRMSVPSRSAANAASGYGDRSVTDSMTRPSREIGPRATWTRRAP